MKKLKQSLIYPALLFIVLTCMNVKCKDVCKDSDPEIICGSTPFADRMLSPYKEGNWWVYQNTSGTIRDSIWLEFEEEKLNYTDRHYSHCEVNPEKTYSFRSNNDSTGYLKITYNAGDCRDKSVNVLINLGTHLSSYTLLNPRTHPPSFFVELGESNFKQNPERLSFSNQLTIKNHLYINVSKAEFTTNELTLFQTQLDGIVAYSVQQDTMYLVNKYIQP